jgi:glutamyl-tRNA synthetase
MNGEYIRGMPAGELADACRAELVQHGLWQDTIDKAYFQSVVGMMQERIKRVPEFSALAGYFFTEDFRFDEKAVKKRLKKDGALDGLAALRTRYAVLDPFNAETAEGALRDLAEELDVSAGALVHPVRVATSGLAGGPSLFEMLELLGRQRVVDRMDRALSRFG